MSKTFTRRPRRHPSRVDQSPPSQESSSSPTPSSESSEPWTSQQPHKYLDKGAPLDIWEKCNEVVERHDEKVCNDLKDEITFLMVVAGLFLAIVTAFTIESYKSLQEDKQDTMSDLLVEVVRLLNDTSVQGRAQLPKRFTTDHSDVVVNQLWYMSSTLSLVAVLLGTYCLQWISAYQRGTDLRDKSLSPTDVLGMRRLRYEGFIGWHVHHAPEVLLLIVQLSIALFTSGLIYFLWNINHAAAIPSLVVASITGILLCVVNVMPFLQSFIGIFYPKFLTLQCPYKSPTSWLVRIVCDSLALALKQLIKQWENHRTRLGRFAVWLERRPAPWSDYGWRAHDVSWASLQDLWDICSRSRSIALGLSLSLNILVLEHDAVDIIRKSMESLRLTFNKANNLQMVFGQKLPNYLQRVFDGRHHVFNNSHSALTREDQQTYFTQFVNDFLSALILQNLVTRSMKLRRILLHHRAELYIRLRNSMQFLFSGDRPFFDAWVISLESPVVRVSEVEGWDLELRFQFLTYLNGAASTGFPIRRSDCVVAAEIIFLSGSVSHFKKPATRCAYQSPGVNEMGASEGGGKASHVVGTPEVARPACSAHDTSPVADSPPKWQPMDFSITDKISSDKLLERIYPAIDTDVGDERSSANGEDLPLSTAFRPLCLEVAKWLNRIPESLFEDKDLYDRMRLRLNSTYYIPRRLLNKSPTAVETGV